MVVVVVVGLCETNRRGEGLIEPSGGSWMYEVGKTKGWHS